MDKEVKTEVLLCQDTTGSMSPCNKLVRQKVEWALTTLFKELPNLHIGLGYNGDYCDRGSTYVTRWHNFSTDIHSLTQFVRNTPNTGGGDLPECYELVLREAQKLNWSHNAKKILVLNADDIPHPPSYPENTLHLDWRKEAHALCGMGISVYCVQWLNKTYAHSFYHELAEITGGVHLMQDQFSEVVDLIMAICYQQAGPEQLQAWEERVAREKRMSRALDQSFAVLSGRKSSTRFNHKERDLEAVPFGRFQILDVDKDIKVRDFTELNGLTFKKGAIFYEFINQELIQETKEVVLRDKETGDMFTGARARELIGLPLGKRGRVRPAEFKQYDVFVQSTSYTRKLDGGTRMLYEVDLTR